MNLVVDIGNTRIKCALFNNNELVELCFYNSFEQLLEDKNLIDRAKQAIIGSVINGAEELQQTLNKQLPTLLFEANTKTPLINDYQSTATLGSDRLLAAVAGYYLYPNSSVLTIDAGTCFKYNFVNDQNHYLGGGISPGLTMRFKALHKFTSKLPLVELDTHFNDLIGTNTQNSMLSGVINGAVVEIDGTIDAYKKIYPHILVLLTGGDSEFLSKRLKNSIFTHQNLVLKGLNHILNYHLESFKS